MRAPKKVEFFRYWIPVNEPAEEGASVTYALLTFISSRARQRHVIIKKFLQQHFGLNRKDSLRAIRELGFDDLQLCKELNMHNSSPSETR